MSETPMPPFDQSSVPDAWYAVYTIQLGELIEMGVFDWSFDELNWQNAAYDSEQYERVCAYFIERFYWREVSIMPFGQWAQVLRRKLVYELMPKYKPLYDRISEGIDPISSENEYYKNRTIDSAYPETLLSANADYITEGKDEEFQRIKEGSLVNGYNDYVENFRAIDTALLDELESMFICLYSLNMNTGW